MEFFKTIYAGLDPSRNRVVIPARAWLHRLVCLYCTTNRFLLSSFLFPIDCFKIPAQTSWNIYYRKKPGDGKQEAHKLFLK
jgi:hypothetical protein